MKILVQILREPLLHFLILGGLIFQLSEAAVEPVPGPAGTIVVGPERIEQLATGFISVWRRPPTEDELRAVIDEFIREEIYYREALALGLDRDDAVVRRRLRQKMEFLADTGADLLRPGPGELEAYLSENEQDFRREPRLAFEQVYLGTVAKPAEISDAFNALRANEPADITLVGQRTLLPAGLRLSPPSLIDGTFGQGFFAGILELPLGTWAGPVESAYGLHLVRVTQNSPASVPSLDEIREAVLREWKAEKASEIRERQYNRLREQYVVEINASAVLSTEFAAEHR